MSGLDIGALRERIGDRVVVASVSGGKDSAAMSLWLHEMGLPHERVFLDTGWEHPATLEYLRGPLAAKLGPITEIRGRLSKPAQARIDALLLAGKLSPRVRAALHGGSLMVALILASGMFPSKRRRFCTLELKVYAMQRYLEARDEVINCVGIRRAESEARANMSEWEWSEGFDCEVWRPLVNWTEQEVIDIHRRHNLAPNPLYLRGASRVGCWPCIYARKAEIRHIADTDPERIALLRELEADVKPLARARYAERGETMERIDDVAPSWFQAPIGGNGQPWPIDRVVEWSRTVRGGRTEDTQAELFAGINDGCMRWGLCETDDSAVRAP
jgi:3'-phosphoadenosine 5'-phosphosulfate sulfotransferase (PAPS reductase)/FAD synthetase